MIWYLTRRDGLSVKLNLVCGDYMGDWLKKEMLYSIGKVPNREATILSSFDKLWGAKEVMCLRLDKKVF